MSVASTIRLAPGDNVVVARVDIAAGTPLDGPGITAVEAVPAGHKVAVCDIREGAPVRKYDQIIGFASAPIGTGRHVHVQNCAMGDFERDHAFGRDAKATAFVPTGEGATFEGYVRADGRVGTRNYIGVLTTVNCSASAARFIADAVGEDLLADHPHVDGVVALTHSTGCGMAGAGEGYENLQRVLWGHARHPNFAGIVLVGLGCEVNQIDFLLEAYGIERGARFRTMNIQDTGGLRRTVARGRDLIRDMLPEADRARRTTASASELTVALQCGGSDGYSGITANPALGGSRSILLVASRRHRACSRETPEIYGAEHLLTRRAVSDAGDRAQAGRYYRVVAGLYTPRTERRRDGQQSVPRQQGRRPDDHPRKITWRHGQGRLDNI